MCLDVSGSMGVTEPLPASQSQWKRLREKKGITGVSDQKKKVVVTLVCVCVCVCDMRGRVFRCAVTQPLPESQSQRKWLREKKGITGVSDQRKG